MSGVSFKKSWIDDKSSTDALSGTISSFQVHWKVGVKIWIIMTMDTVFPNPE